MQNMITFISFAFWLAVLFATWRLWKRVIRDMVRDTLFDLRDSWRMHWIKTGNALDDPFYGYVRRQINGYLRYTAQWRMLDTWYIVRHIDEIEPIAREYRARKMPEPAAPNKETQELAAKMRINSIETLRAYMLLTSVLFCPIVAVVALVMMLMKTFDWASANNKALDWVSSKIPAGNERLIESAVTIGNFGIA